MLHEGIGDFDAGNVAKDLVINIAHYTIWIGPIQWRQQKINLWGVRRVQGRELLKDQEK